MTINIKGIPVYYEEHGKGLPILCIHGYSVDHRLMLGCLEPIFGSPHGYRRIYIDLPGMGKTPAPDWLKNADDMLDVITVFIKEVIGNANFLIIGQSYGGYLTQGLLHTMSNKISGAFLLCPVIYPDFSKRTLPKHRNLYKSADFSESDEFLQIVVVATPQVYELHNKYILPGIKAADNEFAARYRIDGYAFSFDAKLRNVQFDKPATILVGRQDSVVGYADMIELLENFPRATFAILDCTGHGLQIENHTLFSTHVKDWLQRSSYES
ncbi:MAG: alpha/beta hydrolase [Defluviitaleaceae bacterium]|nr:alpha/beta hydrolase [Defluviitaleaceae bacterium]